MGSYAGNLTSFKFPDSRAKDAKDTRFQWKESRAKNAENAKFFPMRIWRTRINSCAVTLTLTMTMTTSGMFPFFLNTNHTNCTNFARILHDAAPVRHPDEGFGLTQKSRKAQKGTTLRLCWPPDGDWLLAVSGHPVGRPLTVDRWPLTIPPNL